MDNPEVKNLPFLFGSQYYRAPTPEPECWQEDHNKMRDIGFNAVKYWVQWRWSHHKDADSIDRFVFDDVDRLMDLALTHNLKVTVNTVFDVAPHWLFDQYPDAKQIRCDGRVIEPYTVGHRQIGGHPGPCYNHPAALLERQKFLRAVIEHFRGHPAIAMWDIWNEPELSFPQRNPNVESMACYCPHCQSGFLSWLDRKYGSLEAINQAWGRCYQNWQQVETPRNPHTILDYIDWREFHIDTMTAEASWRLEMVKELDPTHVRYLHVVPNVMSVFNSVACCADDFALAELCQVFAATMNGGPVYAPQVLSAGRGKLCYNVESHLNFGMTNMHQRQLDLNDLLRDWLPQIGLGIRGFLFWQFRPEVLGFESPAWGVVGLDGSDRPITRALRTFWQKLSPYIPLLMECPAPDPQIAIWKSRKNEIFHFGIHGSLTGLVESVEGYIQALYWRSRPYRIIDDRMLSEGKLDGIKLLIMPSCYYLTEPEARSLALWVKQGGVLVAEAHLAGYNGTTGRHSRILPGCGLAEEWGIREIDTTSSYHLKLEKAEAFSSASTEDVRKAMQDFQTSGGKYFPISLASGEIAWGADRYATLSGENIQPEGWFGTEAPCLATIPVGKGWVFYAGTNLGQGAQHNSEGLHEILETAAGRARIDPPLLFGTDSQTRVHIDELRDTQGNLRGLIVQNSSDLAQTIMIPPFPETDKRLQGKCIFTGTEWDPSTVQIELPPQWIDLVIL